MKAPETGADSTRVRPISGRTGPQELVPPSEEEDRCQPDRERRFGRPQVDRRAAARIGDLPEDTEAEAIQVAAMTEVAIVPTTSATVAMQPRQ